MKRVLIVDDTKNIRLLLTKCLQLEGYEVVSVATGPEGLEHALAGDFDLIFLDIKLPELSGTEILRRMRAEDIQTPVIIITAYPTIKNAVECTRLGVVAYLQKPFTAQRLKNTLQDLHDSGIIHYGGPVSAAVNILESGQSPRQAINLLTTALSHDPANGEIYHLLAQAYTQLGDHEKAARFIAAAQAFDA